MGPALWYRRRGIWLLATAVVVPFGWLLPLGRLVWECLSEWRSRGVPGGHS